MRTLDQPVAVFNVDGTRNQDGDITHSLGGIVEYQGHREETRFEITKLGSILVILGHTWLTRHNPEIDWVTGQVTLNRCPKNCFSLWPQGKWLRSEESWERANQEFIYRTIRRLEDELEAKEIPQKQDPASLVPRELHEYLSVFSEKESERMPDRKAWDHAIDLKEGFVPKKGRIIPLSVDEQEEVRNFVKDHLRNVKTASH